MSHGALSAGIEDWLLGQALEDPETPALFQELCVRLRGIGVPIERALMTWLIVHPLFGAEEVVWRRDAPLELEQRPHAAIGTPMWQASPMAHVHRHGLAMFRRRLAGPDALCDFPVLEHFAEQGFTDYLITSTPFRVGDLSGSSGGGTGMLATWATRRPSGYSADDLAVFERLRKPLAVAVHASIQRRVMTNIATTYLGPTAGRRVIAGSIRRGDGETIPSVLWFSDLRGSTRLSDEMAPAAYLGLLNSYYDCTAAPVIEAGGEILTFIGDGVLGAFRLDPAGPERAVAAAEAAARAAIARRLDLARDGAPLQFGIGLALGDVMIGNIGVPARLAFSGISASVNRAQRIESATKTLGTPVLAERAVAEAGSGAWCAAGTHALPGLAEAIELYRLDPPPAP